LNELFHNIYSAFLFATRLAVSPDRQDWPGESRVVVLEATDSSFHFGCAGPANPMHFHRPRRNPSPV